MKRKEMIVANLALLILVIFFGALTVKLSINEGLVSAARSVAGLSTTEQANSQTQARDSSADRCSSKPALKLDGFASEPHLAKLAQYQRTCGSAATTELMIFTSFPANLALADSDAVTMANRLKTFAAAGVKPLVIVEPYAGDAAMSYKEYLAGKYDAAVDRYFQRLREAGITDAMLGTWVPFPESNTPAWNNKDTEPRDFALCVNRYLQAYKKQFPTAKASILLNATTYEPDDLEYNNGDYISLIPYLQDLDKSLVNSVGIQGFPFVSRATQARREIFKADEFLQPDLAIEAAKELRTRDIWFNTGTFAAKYTNNQQNRVVISANERKAILAGIVETAKNLQTYQQNEYRIAINLFSEDKSGATEATDWAYFQSADHETIFRSFMASAADKDIPVSLYDKAK